MTNNIWKGFKDFIVYDKVQEDEVVTSFYLKAADGTSLPKAIPGQFISVRIQKGDNEPYGIDVSSDVVILASNTIVKEKADGTQKIYTYNRDGSYTLTEKTKVKSK